jgi:hypothetical protein
MKATATITLLCCAWASFAQVQATDKDVQKPAENQIHTITFTSLEALGKFDIPRFSQPDFSVRRKFGTYNWADAAHQIQDYRFMADLLYRTQDCNGRDIVYDAITPEMMNRLIYKEFP